MRSINCMQFGMPQSITDIYFFLNVGMFFFILTFCNNWPGSRIKHKWWLVVFSRNFKTCQHHKINCLEFNRTAAVFFISRQPTSGTNRWRNIKDNSSSRACNSVSSLQIFVWLASMIPTLSCIVTVSFKAQWFACTKYQIRTNTWRLILHRNLVLEPLTELVLPLLVISVGVCLCSGPLQVNRNNLDLSNVFLNNSKYS